jgi:hypothetical protein
MSGFPIVDLVVGIIFIYFLLSIISSSAVEIILTMGKYRARMLEQWLLTIFDKDITSASGKTVKLGQAIMDHCSTTALSRTGHATSYIDAKNFTSALIEKITYDPSNPKSAATDIDGLITAFQNSKLLPHELQGVLLNYAFEAKDTYRTLSVKVLGEMEMFKTKIETWYDTSMDRVSGALKSKYIRRFTFWIAILVAVGLNADSISIAKYLYKNPEARTQLVAHAYTAVNNDSIKKEVAAMMIHDNNATHKDSLSMQQLTDTLSNRIREVRITKAILDDAIPLGWNASVFNDAQGKFSWPAVASKITGLFATILAIMMGAPFWFDLLNKISNMRGSGSKPVSQAEKTP